MINIEFPFQNNLYVFLYVVTNCMKKNQKPLNSFFDSHYFMLMINFKIDIFVFLFLVKPKIIGFYFYPNLIIASHTRVVIFLFFPLNGKQNVEPQKRPSVRASIRVCCHPMVVNVCKRYNKTITRHILLWGSKLPYYRSGMRFKTREGSSHGTKTHFRGLYVRNSAAVNISQCFN